MSRAPNRPGGVGGRQRCLQAVLLVKGEQVANVDITHTIAVGQAKGILVLDMLGHPFQATAGHCLGAGVDEGDAPGLGVALVHFHAVVRQIEGYVGHVQEIVGKVFLDDIALVATANHKIVDAVVGIRLQDVPEHRHATDFDHRLRFDVCFLGNAGAETTGQNDSFHA